jgi:hypothetical protein
MHLLERCPRNHPTLHHTINKSFKYGCPKLADNIWVPVCYILIQMLHKLLSNPRLKHVTIIDYWCDESRYKCSAAYNFTKWWLGPLSELRELKRLSVKIYARHEEDMKCIEKKSCRTMTSLGLKSERHLSCMHSAMF